MTEKKENAENGKKCEPSNKGIVGTCLKINT